MGLFGKRTVIVETDEKKAKEQLFKMIKGLPFDSQKNYKTFLHYHRVGDHYNPNIIYYFHQDRLLKVPRKASIG